MEPADSTASIIQESQNPTDDALKLVIVCVGLPARGKSYITKKLQRYLNWMQYNTKIFNVGNMRRQLKVTPSKYPIQGPTVDHSTPIPNLTPSPCISKNHSFTTPEREHRPSVDENDKHDGNDDVGTLHDSSIFDHSNKENFQMREQWAKETLDQLLDYLLSDDGNVGIFDATNTTKARRKWIVETINKRTKGSVKILFLESICTDTELIEKNIRLKLSGPDYKKMDPEKALLDFRKRLYNYEKVYETIDESEELENEKFDIQYVKIINAGKKVISYNISGYLASQCVFFLLNFNLTDRQIWLTANGESIDNVQNKLGGDSDLTKSGIAFAKALPKFISQKIQEFKLRQYNKEFINDTSTFKTNPNLTNKSFNIYTSTLKRTIETAHYFPKDEYFFKSFKILNDLGCGIFESITEDDFRYLHPDEYMASLENKLSYRYPGLGGESYLDVISRVRPIIVEIERLRDHVLIISHRVIIRVLLCYYMNLNKEMLTELDVQHNYVYCVEPKPYGLDLKIWQYEELTNMFIEVDVAEIMKRKRKRKSLVVNDVERLRRLLIRHSATINYDSDDILTTERSDNGDSSDEETESETESEENSTDSVSRINSRNSPLQRRTLSEKSESQPYEFAKASSTDLKALAQVNNLKTKSLSNASLQSLGSGNQQSCTSLSSLTNLRKHLRGSSSDLRSLPAQANKGIQFHSPTSPILTPSLTPAITLSRKNSYKHIKKPSIDWDLFDHNVETDENLLVNSHRNSGTSMHSKLQLSESASSGTSSTTPASTVLDAEVDLIMSNPQLLDRILQRLNSAS